MQIEDTTVIIKATPLFPSLMHEDADKVLIKEFNELQQKKKELSELRQRVCNLGLIVEVMKENFKNQAELFNIEYGTKEANLLPSDNTFTGDVMQRTYNK